MSSRAPRVAGLVCEGPSDFSLFESIVRSLWPAVSQVLYLHPQIDATGHALGDSGWSGVRTWCLANTGKLDRVLDPGIGERIDLLLVAIDADIAAEVLVAEASAVSKSTHPPTQLREQVEGWLGAGPRAKLPTAIMVSTPTMAIETWVIAALYPSQRAPEAIASPSEFLITKRQLDRDPRRPKKAKKPPATYRRFATVLAAKLPQVRKRCPEAERTAGEIEQRRAAVER